MKVVIVRSCLETLTPRAIKNARALAAAGYETTVLAWDREAVNPKHETKDGYHARRFKFRAPLGPRVLLYLPVWWGYEFLWLMRNHWDVVHAMDLDTVPPAMLAARIKRKPLVYEIADVYEDMIVLPRILRKISVSVDKLFMRSADAIIISDDARVRELGGIPNDNVTVIYNSPPDLSGGIITPPQKGELFTIFYSSVLRADRQSNLDRVARAVRDIDGTRLVIAGYGNQTGEIERWAREAPDKVRFAGRISYAESLERTMTADLVVALYDPEVLNSRYASANKLFEAMMCGKPILVSKNTAMADIVMTEDCGLVVDTANAEEITGAIIKLRDDPQLCQRLGARGRKAYEQRYNWETMRQRLLDCYRGLK